MVLVADNPRSGASPSADQEQSSSPRLDQALIQSETENFRKQISPDLSASRLTQPHDQWGVAEPNIFAYADWISDVTITDSFAGQVIGRMEFLKERLEKGSDAEKAQAKEILSKTFLKEPAFTSDQDLKNAIDSFKNIVATEGDTMRARLERSSSSRASGNSAEIRELNTDINRLNNKLEGIEDKYQNNQPGSNNGIGMPAGQLAKTPDDLKAIENIKNDIFEKQTRLDEIANADGSIRLLPSQLRNIKDAEKRTVELLAAMGRENKEGGFSVENLFARSFSLARALHNNSVSERDFDRESYIEEIGHRRAERKAAAEPEVLPSRLQAGDAGFEPAVEHVLEKLVKNERIPTYYSDDVNQEAFARRSEAAGARNASIYIDRTGADLDYRIRQDLAARREELSKPDYSKLQENINTREQNLQAKASHLWQLVDQNSDVNLTSIFKTMEHGEFLSLGRKIIETARHPDHADNKSLQLLQSKVLEFYNTKNGRATENTKSNSASPVGTNVKDLLGAKLGSAIWQALANKEDVKILINSLTLNQKESLQVEVSKALNKNPEQKVKAGLDYIQNLLPEQRLASAPEQNKNTNPVNNIIEPVQDFLENLSDSLEYFKKPSAKNALPPSTQQTIDEIQTLGGTELARRIYQAVGQDQDLNAIMRSLNADQKQSLARQVTKALENEAFKEDQKLKSIHTALAA